MNNKMWLKQVQETNQYTAKYGLVLSEEDSEILLAEKNKILRSEQRVELGQGILPQIIFTFCDSSYIYQDNYMETLIRLQEIFYLYKNEMQDEISDDELLCFNIFAQAVRAGYRGFRKTRGMQEFSKLDIVKRWDKELYLETLKDLC